MIVRIRQRVEELRNGLTSVPLVFAVGAVLLAFTMLRIDAWLGDDLLPIWLRTSAANARSVLSTIAGGLISAVTLMLSLMLVAIQLGSSQYSPRTLTNWLGDRILQVAIGLAVGTVIYCLVVLQTVDNFAEADSFESPHRAVLLALILGLGSIVGVVRSVDHLAKSLRVGTVAETIMVETLGLINRLDDSHRIATQTRATVSRDASEMVDPRVVCAEKAGWVQQIDHTALLEGCPEGGRIEVLTRVGSFTLDNAPLLQLSGVRSDEEFHEIADTLVSALAVGSARTMQQDIGFGFLRLTDIALRALSPGVNDPNTAIDVLNHVGTLLLAAFEREESSGELTQDNRTVIVPQFRHGEHVDQTFGAIRHAAAGAPTVLATICRLSSEMIDEIRRRDLPADPSIFTETANSVAEHLQHAPFVTADTRLVSVELDRLQNLLGDGARDI